MCADEIILEVEGTPVKCKKKELIANSDYFKAMLEGNFVERDKRNITLEGVDLKAVNIILTLLWDESCLIENEDLLLVLQTACMLQFVKIKNLCIEKITEILAPVNCIKVWCITEQLDIKPLFIKAKAMALEEFLNIKDGDCILELPLEKLCNYLGHIYLKTDNELTVFQAAIKWWYENCDGCFDQSTKILLKLLSCIDYQGLLDHYLKEIMTYPDIASNLEITEILSCVLLIKSGKPLDGFSEARQERARLLYKSKSRESPQFPCMVVNFIQSADRSKKAKIPNQESQQKVVYYDKFKRKRFYQLLEDNKSENLTTIYYDLNSKEFKKLFDIDGKKCQKLDGFKLIGYKEFVFMYGGEHLIGKGNWNKNFWVYDMIREKWERKSVLAFLRRHFETCMVGNILYIIGGTGMYRVLQENMFWYNYKDDKWSGQITLPCSSRQLKCCNFLNRLFVLSIHNKCGYLFNEGNFLWEKLKITIDDTVISSQSEFSVFSYKNFLYIKGKNLIEFVVKDKELVVVAVKTITDMTCDKMEVVLCNNIVCTIYNCKVEDSDTYSYELYNLDTGDMEFVFKDAPSDAVIDIDDDQYVINPSLKTFSFKHYTLVEEDRSVNNGCDQFCN